MPWRKSRFPSWARSRSTGRPADSPGHGPKNWSCTWRSIRTAPPTSPGPPPCGPNALWRLRVCIRQSRSPGGRWEPHATGRTICPAPTVDWRWPPPWVPTGIVSSCWPRQTTSRTGPPHCPWCGVDRSRVCGPPIGRSWTAPHRPSSPRWSISAVGSPVPACALGDPRGAEWSARKGLLVSPYDERLYRMLLRAADAAGNPGGVESVMAELVRIVADEVEPVESVHPSTLALYRSLSRRPDASLRPPVRS